MTTPRKCFAILVGQGNEHGYVPSLVTENEPGHQPAVGRDDYSVPWYWGKTEEEAQAICDKINAENGISPEDAAEIVASSIRAQNNQDAHRAAVRERMDRLGLT